MLSFFIFFILGFGFAYFAKRKKLEPIYELVFMISGAALIFLIGFDFVRITQNNNILMIKELLISIAFATVITIGSVLSSLVLLYLCNSEKTEKPESKPKKNKRNGWLLIANLLILVIGGICGYIFSSFQVGSMMNVFLMILIFAAGLLTGARIRSHSVDTRKIPLQKLEILKYLFLPPVIMVGSLAAAALFAILTGTNLIKGLLYAAPMGWQTMGGPLIIQLTNVKTGTMAFNVNLFRDILSFLIIPLLARCRFGELPISAGGTSSMDILLPSIIASSGKKQIMLAVWCGACCAFWAPFIIYFLTLK